MKLKTFNRTTFKSLSTGRATIRFTRQGTISISGKAAEKMNLAEGDKIEFCQSMEDYRDWYIHKTQREDGFILRKFKDGLGLMFSSSKLSSMVLDSVDATDKSVAFVVSGTPEVIDGENYYFIITRTQIKK
ncbi:MAG: hypothetical protein AAGU18_10995 [Proteiniphilum sp.]